MPIILTTWEAEIGRMAIEAILGKQFLEPPSQQTIGYSDSYLLSKLRRRLKTGRSHFQASQGISFCKISSQQKKVGVVVCLSSQKSLIGKSWSRPSWAKSETLSPK
jgi:hypothetical protein